MEPTWLPVVFSWMCVFFPSDQSWIQSSCRPSMHRPCKHQCSEGVALLYAPCRFTRAPEILRSGAKWSAAEAPLMRAHKSVCRSLKFYSRTCQNCWLTITFAEDEQFWNGCHTSTNGLYYTAASHHVTGPGESQSLLSVWPACKKRVLPSFGWRRWGKYGKDRY